MSDLDSDSQPSRFSWALRPFIALCALGIIGLRAQNAWPFFSDDAFISLRYAERLLAGHGLTWNDGEWVEGYSNLLWVLGCAGLGGIGLHLVAAARLLGILCTFGVLLALTGVAPLTRRQWPAAVVGPVLYAVAAPTAVWAIGGLEAPMVAMLLAWAALWLWWAMADWDAPGTVRRLLLASVPLALLCVTRPDGPLFAGIAFLAVVLRARGGMLTTGGAGAAVLALPVVAVIGQLAFRVLYYGDWLPNTAYAKGGVSVETFTNGLPYVLDGMWVLRGALLLGGIGLIWGIADRWLRAGTLTLLAMGVAWLLYLAAIGGDHFPAWRHHVVPLVLLCLLASVPVRWLSWREGATTTVVAQALMIACAVLTWYDGQKDPTTLRAREETWEWKGKAVGDLLGRAFGDRRPLFAVDASGALPFYSRLQSLDMLGLNDQHIARMPPPGVLPVYHPGHMLGDGDYVMGRKPDLMSFGAPPGLPLPVFSSAVQFEDDPRFRDGYRCVLLDTGAVELKTGETVALRAPLWFRLGGVLGVKREVGQVTIPGYLIGSYQEPDALMQKLIAARTGGPATDEQWRRDQGIAKVWFEQTTAVAVWDSTTGGVLGELRDHLPHRLVGLELSAGAWQVEAVGSGELAVRLLHADGTEVSREGGAWIVGPGERVDLECRVPEAVVPPVRVVEVKCANGV